MRNISFCHCEETSVDVAIVFLPSFVVSFVLFVYSSYGLPRFARNDILDGFVIVEGAKECSILSLRGDFSRRGNRLKM